MADQAPKKEEGKKDPVVALPPTETSIADTAEKIFLLIIGLALLYRAYTLLTAPRTDGRSRFSYLYDHYQGLEPFIHRIILTYTAFATIASLFFLIAVVYTIIKLSQVENQWHEKLYPTPPEEAATEEASNSRWKQILGHIESGNPSDWRLSILECDIILGDLLGNVGYRGDTIGDKLKSAERSPFRTLQAAWEAHKIRNAIAHEGQDFVLTQREARRVIGLYESVFKEFDYI